MLYPTGADGTQLVERAANFLLLVRVNAIAEQDSLIAQGNLAVAIEQATTYLNDCACRVAGGRLIIAHTEQDQVGSFVTTVTTGVGEEDRLTIMREALSLIEREMDFAKERLAGLRLLANVGAVSSDSDGIKPFV